MLTFDSEHSSGVVVVNVLNDMEREVAIETVNLKLSFVDDEANNNILICRSQALLSIVDDDGQFKVFQFFFVHTPIAP